MTKAKEKLTPTECIVLASYWGYPLRQRNGKIEGQKRTGGAWGVLYDTIEEAKKNARILMGKEKSDG